MIHDWVDIQAAIHAWVVAGSGLTAQQVVWGQQDAPRPPGPGIVMRFSNIAETGRTWLDTEPNPLVFTAKSITAVDATANTLTSTAHTLVTGDGPVQLTTTGTAPGGLAVATNYWVVVVDVNTLKLASTFENAMNGQPASPAPITIDLTSAGSGTMTLVATATTVRAGQEIHALARGLLNVTLELRCHSATGVGINQATSILTRVKVRRGWPSQQALLEAVNVSVMDIARVRALMGIRDALLFQPKSMTEVHICVPAEEIQDLTRIDSVVLTDLIRNRVINVP